MINCLAVIPARGGSTRIPGKNKRVFAGYGLPIIQHSISRALDLGCDLVVVSTDDRDIADIAMSQGALAMYRPADLCQNEVGTQDVISWVVKCFANIKPDYVCGIYPTAPMLETDDLMRAWRVLQEHDHFHYAMGVGTEPLRDAGLFYFGRFEAFMHRRPLLTANTAMIPIPEKRVCDINTLEDFEKAEVMYAALHSGK